MVDITDRDIRRLTRTLLGAVLVLVTYWALWAISRSTVASAHTTAYYDFEDAFPVADAWLGACALLAVRAARTARPTTLLWTLVGGGSGVYLAAMDVLYDLEHGVYTSGGGGIIELLINLITVSVSVWTLRWGWLRRCTILSLASRGGGTDHHGTGPDGPGSIRRG
jgi:hypothetical protein